MSHPFKIGVVLRRNPEKGNVGSFFKVLHYSICGLEGCDTRKECGGFVMVTRDLFSFDPKKPTRREFCCIGSKSFKEVNIKRANTRTIEIGEDWNANL